MQSRAVNHFARLGVGRCGVISQPTAPAMSQSQRWNSFIKNVMDQVKKDMENDPKMREDWQKWQKTKETVETRSQRNAERLEDLTSKFKSASSKTSEYLNQFKERTREVQDKASERYSEATKDSESLKKAQEFMKQGYESGASVSSGAFEKTRPSSLESWTRPPVL